MENVKLVRTCPSDISIPVSGSVLVYSTVLTAGQSETWVTLIDVITLFSAKCNMCFTSSHVMQALSIAWDIIL